MIPRCYYSSSNCAGNTISHAYMFEAAHPNAFMGP